MLKTEQRISSGNDEKFGQITRVEFESFIHENLFDLLGARHVEAEEKVAFLNILLNPAWNNFLTTTVGRYLNDEQLIKLRQLQEIDRHQDLLNNSNVKLYLAGILRNLDELMLKEVLDLKKKLFAVRKKQLGVNDELLLKLLHSGEWDRVRDLMENANKPTTLAQLLEWLDQIRVKNSGPDNFDLEISKIYSEWLIDKGHLHRGKNSTDILAKQTAQQLFEVGEWRRAIKVLQEYQEGI